MKTTSKKYILTLGQDLSGKNRKSSCFKSNEGMTVLDNTMGGGSTGVAAKRLKHNFIGMKLEENYFEIAK